MSLSVLQVATNFPGWGGAELHVLNLSDQLCKRGYDVTVACRPGRWVESQAIEMGLTTFPLEVSKQFDFRDFRKLRQLLRERSFDVVHVHWSSDALVHGLAGLMEHVPVRVLTRHMPYPFKSRFGTQLYSRWLFTRLVTVSSSVRETLLRCGVAPDRVEVIHHGTDVETFARTTESPRTMRDALGIPDNRVVVGIVGRIVPEKGHGVFLEAARILDDRYPVHYVVVGSGPNESALRAQVQEAGLTGRFLFAGFREDINNVIGAMDIVAVPSVWNEPCSAVVQQAMALSKPVIGTRVGGTPEMVQDGITGLLIPPSNANALAEAIATLAGDAFARRRMGTAGRRLVESQFSLDVMTDKIEALYHREYAKTHDSALLSGALSS